MMSQPQVTPRFTLHYWPSIPGRGEYIRLLFEYAGETYAESVYTGTLPGLLEGRIPPPSIDPSQALQQLRSAHFAVPLLHVTTSPASEAERDVGFFLSQTPAILSYLSSVLGKGLDGVPPGSSEARPSTAMARAHTLQLALTVLDLANEAHDTHHPIASGRYYEEQRDEARRRAVDFRNVRVPKFLRHFERELDVVRFRSRAGAGAGERSDLTASGPPLRLVGGTLVTFADLALWHTLEGLAHAFPLLMDSLMPSLPLLVRFREEIGALGPIKRYIDSGRRREFSDGLFRRYIELDGKVMEE